MKEELEEQLKKIGFTILRLEDISFKDRIEIFANATLLIGASGAGLVHMVFMEKGTEVIVLGSEQMHKNSSAFSKIAMRKSIRLSIVNAEDSKDIDSPWTANIGEILDMIKQKKCKGAE